MEPGWESELITDLPLVSLSEFFKAEARKGFLIEGGVVVLVQSESGFLFLLASIFVVDIFVLVRLQLLLTNTRLCSCVVSRKPYGFGGKIWYFVERSRFYKAFGPRFLFGLLKSTKF